MAEIARELGCDWRTVNKEVTRWGNALLEADTTRIRQVGALGVDETLFNRSGEWARRAWCTSVVDVQRGQLIDIVPGRDSKAATGWLKSQPPTWLAGIRWAVLDLSGPYRTAWEYSTMLSKAAAAYSIHSGLPGSNRNIPSKKPSVSAFIYAR